MAMSVGEQLFLKHISPIVTHHIFFFIIPIMKSSEAQEEKIGSLHLHATESRARVIVEFLTTTCSTPEPSSPEPTAALTTDHSQRL